MNASRENQAQPTTTTLSVRLPAKEAEKVKAKAAKAGLNISDYIRLLLVEKTVFVDVYGLDSVVEKLIKLEKLMEKRIEVLDVLAIKIENHGLTPENAELLDEEFSKDAQLMQELSASYEKLLDVATGFLKGLELSCEAISD